MNGTVVEERVDLALESRRISRYLLDVDPPRELVDRYLRANALLFPAPPSVEDEAILDLVRRHAWSLPFLDAAAGLIRPDSLLRRKILLMLAILETSPELARRFEPEDSGKMNLFLRLTGVAIASVVTIGIGLGVFAVVRRARCARSSSAA